jgi:hypothetical protein
VIAAVRIPTDSSLFLKDMNDFFKGIGALGILLILLIALPIAAPFVILIMIIAGLAWIFGLSAGNKKEK